MVKKKKREKSNLVNPTDSVIHRILEGRKGKWIFTVSIYSREENHRLLHDVRGPVYAVCPQIETNTSGTRCCVWDSLLASGGQLSIHHVLIQVSLGEARCVGQIHSLHPCYHNSFVHESIYHIVVWLEKRLTDIHETSHILLLSLL